MTTWGRGNYTLRSKEWRYTRYFDGSEELYNQITDSNEWTNLALFPEYDDIEIIHEVAPKEEASQVASGRELYNVADADNPIKNINSYKRYVKQYKAEGLTPS